MTSTYILAGLNPAQLEAVTHADGPLLILAGPGSGKTRVIAHRIAYLVSETGVAPPRIMAVTFTNKAARELRDRVEGLLGPVARGLTLGTFHAVCARILRVDGEAIGVPRGFVIFDDGDQMALMKRICAEYSLEPRQYPPRAILSVISRAKSELDHPYLLRGGGSALLPALSGAAHREQRPRLRRHPDQDRRAAARARRDRRALP
jgi:DNA helicase-2/ATP-dependent DNA helicase PcrA